MFVAAIALLPYSDARPCEDETAVRWAISQDGGAWHSNYLRIYGKPATDCLVVDLHDVTAHRLGAYYLHYADNTQCVNSILKEDALKFVTEDHVRYIPPSSAAFAALLRWSAFKTTGDKAHLDEFMRIASWLVKNQQNGRWEWRIPIPALDMRPPWISAYTQCYAISVMLRAYQETRNRKYLEAARKAMHWVKRSIKNGGVTFFSRTGAWLEEYPNPNTPSHILNGHLAAMLGVWDYYRVTGDPGAKRLFDAAANAVKADIGKYDLGYWFVYSRLNRVDVINASYMNYVAKNLDVLGAITGDSFFSRYGARVSEYLTSESLFCKMATDRYAREHPSGTPSAGR